MRVIADHARATAFLIADGIFPGRTRAVTCCARSCGAPSGTETNSDSKTSSSPKSPTSSSISSAEYYPELRETRGVIERVVTTEEKLYGSTVGAGLNMLEDVMKKTSGNVISGADVFKLYDTYGLNYDLIEYVATQRGFTLDQQGFDAELEKQRQRARESMKGGAAKPSTPFIGDRPTWAERIHRLRRH